MKLGVVIVTYNRIELLKECIANCINQVLKFDKIFVINNASTDGTTEFLNNLAYDNIMVINSKENLGGSGGFYEGIKIALNYDLDYLLLIDDDAILDANYNDEIAKHIKNDKDIYLFICYYLNSEKIKWIGTRTTYDNLLRLIDDPDVREPLKFLREREIVHFQRFGEALRTVQDHLDSKNFYAINPAFDHSGNCNK